MIFLKGVARAAVFRFVPPVGGANPINSPSGLAFLSDKQFQAFK